MHLGRRCSYNGRSIAAVISILDAPGNVVQLDILKTLRSDNDISMHRLNALQLNCPGHHEDRQQHRIHLRHEVQL